MHSLQDYMVHEYVADYQEGRLSRRDLFRRVAAITGSAAAAAAVLSAFSLEPVAAAPADQAQPSPLSVPADDPSVESEDITFPGHDGATIVAYQARPAGTTDALPLVLVCHQNRGLNEHMRDVTRRFAKEGYLACAVDLVSRQGGTAAITDPNQFAALLTGPDVDPNQFTADFAAAVDYYKTQPELAQADRIGMNGYCFGGGVTWRSTEQIPDLKAAVPYYGAPPPLDQVGNIKAAVLGVYSSDTGDFANKGREELDAALTAAGVTHQFKVYPDTRHAFNDDTGPSYNPTQALAAWGDMQDWFNRYLRA
jgi:carboxymethylenebutenolidase